MNWGYSGVKDRTSDELASLASEIEGLERHLAAIRRKLAQLSAGPLIPLPLDGETTSEQSKRSTEGVPKADAVRIALILAGGTADYPELVSTAKELTAFRKKALSSVPAKLVDQGEITRHMGPRGHPVYQVVDALRTISIIRKRPQSYDFLKTQLLGGPVGAERLSAVLLQSYGRRVKSFLISEFLRTVENVADKEVRALVEKNLPRLAAELAAKRQIELTEGLEGLLISGKPISRITWRGDSSSVGS